MSTTNQEKFNPKSICLPQITRSGMQQKQWRLSLRVRIPFKLAESPSNSKSARSLDEPTTSDEFERKTRWLRGG
ncbi:hypothetical protein YC2023_085508 [Brassica napus]